MYKLVKTFLSKWKQQKGKELGGGVKREAVGGGGRRQEEGDEFAPLKMARTAHEQVKTFKVRERLLNNDVINDCAKIT